MKRPILFVMMVLNTIGCRAGDETGAPKPANAGTVNETAKPEPGRKETPKLKEHRSGDWSPGLTDEELRTLFAIARDTLEWSVRESRGKFAFDKYTLTPKLREKCATFVTFKNKGRLRGCIGCLEAYEPMYLSVHRSASNAAQDPRFVYQPIGLSELPQIEIHVSLLSPRREIRSVDEFKIGAHGICMEKGRDHAVYLPEVAVEQNWTKEETLTSLSEKAGLPGDAWKEGARFLVFSSVVIAEK